MISSDYDEKDYLSKYDFINDKFEILFTDVYITTSGDGLLFFDKDNSIYMINTKTDEIKKIIDKLYYGNTYHVIHYKNGKLYFSSGNKVYSYNIESSKISSFKLEEIEEITEISNDYIIGKKSEYFTSYYYWYDYNGNKIKTSNSQNMFYDRYIYQNYIFTFDFNKNIDINNVENKELYEYAIDVNDIYYDETDYYSIERFEGKFLGVYNNKMYVKINYELENKNPNSDNIYDKLYSNEYDGIYYFDISNLDDTKNIKLNAVSSPVKSSNITDVYFLDKYIYLSDNKGIIYKYDLDNNNIRMQYVSQYCCEFKKSYGDYIYGFTNQSIYRVDKNNLKIEKLLGTD